MASEDFQSLRDKYPDAPADAIFAVLFAKNILKDEPDYSLHSAIGRYAIVSDIILRDDETKWIWKILDEEKIGGSQ